jgi:hypothetical protein
MNKSPIAFNSQVKKKKRASNQFVRGGDVVEDDVDEMTVSVVYDSSISISDGNSQTGSDLSDHLSPEEIVTTNQHQITSAIVKPLPGIISTVRCKDALQTDKDNYVFSDPALNDKKDRHQSLFRNGKSDEGDNSGDIRDDITSSTSDSKEVPVNSKKVLIDSKEVPINSKEVPVNSKEVSVNSKEVPVDDVFSIITDSIATSQSEELSSLEVAATTISVSTTILPVVAPMSSAPLLSAPTPPNSFLLTTSGEQTSIAYNDSLSDAPLQPVIDVIFSATKRATQLSMELKKGTMTSSPLSSPAVKEILLPVELNEMTSSAGTLFVNKILLEDCGLKATCSSEYSSGTDITCRNYHKNNYMEGRISDSEYIKKIQVISIDFSLQAAQLSKRRIELTTDAREMRSELQCAETWLIDANTKAAAMEDDQLVYIHIFIFKCLYKNMYTNIYICIYMRTYIYIYIYVYIYMHTYIYIYIYV